MAGAQPHEQLCHTIQCLCHKIMSDEQYRSALPVPHANKHGKNTLIFAVTLIVKNINSFQMYKKASRYSTMCTVVGAKEAQNASKYALRHHPYQCQIDLVYECIAVVSHKFGLQSRCCGSRLAALKTESRRTSQARRSVSKDVNIGVGELTLVCQRHSK
jgi:hypothetical protein